MRATDVVVIRTLLGMITHKEDVSYALDIVEGIARSSFAEGAASLPTAPIPLDLPCLSRVVNAIRGYDRIGLIKEIRALTRLSLLDSKNMVDAVMPAGLQPCNDPKQPNGAPWPNAMPPHSDAADDRDTRR